MAAIAAIAIVALRQTVALLRRVARLAVQVVPDLGATAPSPVPVERDGVPGSPFLDSSTTRNPS